MFSASFQRGTVLRFHTPRAIRNHRRFNQCSVAMQKHANNLQMQWHTQTPGKTISSWWWRMAPVAMAWPGLALTLLAAILSAAASTTLGKLASELFPFAAFVPCALPDTSFGFVLSTEISHDYTSPVLHVLRVMTNGELLHQWKDVVIIRLKEFLHVILVFLNWGGRTRGRAIKHLEFAIDLKSGN